MNQGVLYDWEDAKLMPAQLIVESITDSDDGLKIELRPSIKEFAKFGESWRASITFDPYVAYRVADESFRARSIDAFSGNIPGSLYLIKDSEFLAWFHEESKGIYTNLPVKHYAIMTTADWIDVLSEFPPSIACP